MRFAHLLTAFYFEPWQVRPDKHAAFGQILQEHLKSGRTDAVVQERQAVPYQPGRPIVGPSEGGRPLVPQMTVEEGGIAVIPVWGVLGKRLSWLELWCGGCDYEHIAAFAEMAMEDPGISAVVFDFNSPGGQCRGLLEVEPVLDALSAAKPTYAFTDMICASAAYRLAVHCRSIIASPSACLGSIGTLLAGLDNSREWEIKGWVLELFASGALKAIGCDGKQWTDAERNFLRERMERHQAQFVSVVNAHRPEVAPETMQGQWFDGDQCVELGLTDDLAMNLAKVMAGVRLMGD